MDQRYRAGQHAGRLVHAFEQHDKPGGFCHHWEGQAGPPERPLVFRFDAGVHDVSGCHPVGTVHALLQRLHLEQAIVWRPLEHRLVDARGAWTVPRGWDACVAEMERRHPADAPALLLLAREHPEAVRWPDAPMRDWFEQPEVVEPQAQRRSAAYAARKSAFAGPMIDAAARPIPGLRERIVWRGEASPVSFRRYGWSSFGAVYGSRDPHADVSCRSPVPGLVVAGAATHGPGIEAVVISGADALWPGLLQGAPAGGVAA